MMGNNVIDFQKAKNQRAEVTEVLDTHDAVLDVSNVVFTADDIDYDTTITDDYIIIETQLKEEKEET
jgi:hypothetical protein